MVQTRSSSSTSVAQPTEAPGTNAAVPTNDTATGDVPAVSIAKPPPARVRGKTAVMATRKMKRTVKSKKKCVNVMRPRQRRVASDENSGNFNGNRSSSANNNNTMSAAKKSMSARERRQAWTRKVTPRKLITPSKKKNPNLRPSSSRSRFDTVGSIYSRSTTSSDSIGLAHRSGFGKKVKGGCVIMSKTDRFGRGSYLGKELMGEGQGQSTGKVRSSLCKKGGKIKKAGKHRRFSSFGCMMGLGGAKSLTDNIGSAHGDITDGMKSTNLGKFRAAKGDERHGYIKQTVGDAAENKLSERTHGDMADGMKGTNLGKFRAAKGDERHAYIKQTVGDAAENKLSERTHGDMADGMKGTGAAVQMRDPKKEKHRRFSMLGGIHTCSGDGAAQPLIGHTMTGLAGSDTRSTPGKGWTKRDKGRFDAHDSHLHAGQDKDAISHCTIGMGHIDLKEELKKKVGGSQASAAFTRTKHGRFSMVGSNFSGSSGVKSLKELFSMNAISEQ